MYKKIAALNMEVDKRPLKSIIVYIRANFKKTLITMCFFASIF